MVFKVIKRQKSTGMIKLDAQIRLKVKKSLEQYSEPLRLIKAMVEVDGKIVEMEFITNNLNWSAGSICDLYKSRWGIEVFFKQLKQTLQLADFLGHNENAVRWQIWTALLTYVLLRFISYIGRWKGSFSRLFTIIRGVLWSPFDLFAILNECYGIAAGNIRMIAQPEQLYLPGIRW